MRPLTWLTELAASTEAFLERRVRWVALGLSIAYLATSAAIASAKLFWNDELFTLFVAELPTMRDVWGALETGADQVPPFIHLVTRVPLALFGPTHLGVRLPQIVAFFVLCLTLYAAVARRTAPLYGVVAAAFAMATGAYQYAYEARGYALVLGFGGIAYLGWQRATASERRRWVGLASISVGLAGAVSSHYYAVLLFVPLGLGEIVRTLRTKNNDFALWAAMGIGALPLLLYTPLIRAAASYSTGFWAWPRWRQLLDFHSFLLGPAVIPMAAAAAAMALWPSVENASMGDEGEGSGLPSHELAAIVGFLMIPWACMVLARNVTHAFSPRYALTAVLGYGLLVPHAIYRMPGRRTIVALTLVLSSAAVIGARAYVYVGDQRWLVGYQERVYEFLESQCDEKPVVLIDSGTFTAANHYAPPQLQSRLFYVADAERARRWLGHNTLDRGWLDLRPWLELNISELDRFTTENPSFCTFGMTTEWTWLNRELTRQGRKLELLDYFEGIPMYYVAPP